MTARVLTLALALGMAAWPCRAESPGDPGLAERDPFRAGSLTFQALPGYYNQTRVGPQGPPTDYAPLVLRLGYVFDKPTGDDYLRGCFEAIVEANYSAVTHHDGGSFIAGPDAILRYNFVQPECSLVPYLQVGAGFVLNDAWKLRQGQDQPLLGESFEFLLRAEAGVRYMISDCVSLDIEGGYQHISNAGLSRHNGGVNNLGGTVGFTYFFGAD